MKKGLKDKFDSTTNSMKDKLNDLDNVVNEKKINKQQAKYEKEKKKKEDAKKAAKYGGVLLAILFIFGVVFAVVEDEPEKVPGEPITVSSTEENTSTPAEKEDKDSKEEPNDISDEKKKIGTESNPITVENCPEFASILACKDSYDISYVKFAEEHYGEHVEFVANIQYIYSEYEYGEYWGNVLLCGGEFLGENKASLGPYFRVERAEDEAFDDANFGPHEELHPYGTTVKVNGILRLYDEESQLYELELKRLTNITAKT